MKIIKASASQRVETQRSKIFSLEVRVLMLEDSCPQGQFTGVIEWLLDMETGQLQNRD